MGAEKEGWEIIVKGALKGLVKKIRLQKLKGAEI